MTVHGHRGGGNHKRTRTYNSWRAMIERCTYTRHPFYPIYGGRGIRVFDGWRGYRGFARFLADMGERPAGKTLDRRDPNGDYTPGNCRWATPKQQRWNRREADHQAAMHELENPIFWGSREAPQNTEGIPF